MAAMHLVMHVVFVLTRQWSVEASIFALIAALMLSAELLSTEAVGDAVPDSETLQFIYLAIMQ